ncbi:hypothetical protein EVG20_g6267 [Dentipellis fragilis]|uniref:Calcium uniporter protein, mitochondrial n=1 Tax=Dentipellis fragilis TaxID=205917 RepID=A0A4Y9YR83_9AGAM|nr:hypothetical protein EVG20_g6267 [Dentipellis fragilis]
MFSSSPRLFWHTHTRLTRCQIQISRLPARPVTSCPWLYPSAPRHATTVPPYIRRYASQPSPLANNTADSETENVSAAHARFLADATPSTKWDDKGVDSAESTANGIDSQDDFEGVSEGKGKLLPTSSHLFKLVLPLAQLSSDGSSLPPTVFLLHPSQPLTHIARLILASLPPINPTPDITFRSAGAHRGNGNSNGNGGVLQWSPSTDVGDFIRDAARTAEFTIRIAPAPTTPADASSEALITVQVPTFAARTRFLRARLGRLRGELEAMDALKRECDQLAHRGARRVAVGGFAALVVYWGTVARLTFWDYGWDVMEPITYLSGLSTVIVGYLWFLYRGREVSYSSILSHSIAARRHALYRARGLDMERYHDVKHEVRRLEGEVEGIRRDYDEGGARSREKENEKTDAQENKKIDAEDERDEIEVENEDEEEDADRDLDGRQPRS